MPAFGASIAAVRLAVVLDGQDDVGFSGLETQLHALGLRVLRRIGDRLLRDAIETGADTGRQIVDVAD